jgi:hypothetical protein
MDTREIRAAFVVVDGDDVVSRPDGPLTALEPELVPRPPSGDIHEVGGGGLMCADELGLGDGSAFKITLRGPDEEQLLNGMLICGYARDAVARGDRRKLGALRAAFHHLVLRIPEVHAFLDALPRVAAERLAGRRRAVGRPRNLGHDLACVRSIDRLVELRGISVIAACKMLQQHLQPRVSLRSIQNVYSMHGPHAQIHARGVFVRRAVLTPFEWGAPPMMSMRTFIDR